MALDATPKLPALRDDLEITDGGRDWKGAAQWTVFDPLRNLYFQVDERGFALLACWDEALSRENVCEAVARDFGYAVSEDELEKFLAFLLAAQLIVADTPALRQRLNQVRDSRDVPLWEWLSHKYLFFRIPLLRPDKLLDWLYPRVRWFMSAGFIRITLLVGLLGIILVSLRWQEFFYTVPWFFTVEGAIVFAMTLAGVKIVHELGHGLACKHFGVNVPTMGVAFMVMWPVLYTDASNSWRLSGRRRRALIDSAGVITELMIACYALLLWALLPEGLMKSVAFTLATTTLVLSLLVNLNPFMRFDGYYFLSDITNIPNIQNRSFDLARWRIRQWLFAVPEPAPEVFPSSIQRWLVAYAVATWIYRFFLFLGIAILVYHLFFKALGIILFVVEIWWFIVRPIVNEMKNWRGAMPGVTLRRRLVLSVLLIGAVLLVVIPWRSSFLVPAQLDHGEFQRIFAAFPGKISDVFVAERQVVEADEPLLSLVSAELDYRVRVAELDVVQLQSGLDRASGSADMMSRRLVMEQELVRAEATYKALSRLRDRAIVRSPFSGRVRDLDPMIHDGRWVSEDIQLMTVVAEPGRARVTAWVSEDDIDRLRRGGQGRFYAESGRAFMGLPLQVVKVETSPITELDNPIHAAAFGGAIPARPHENGYLVPETGLYRVWLEPLEGQFPLVDQQVKGWVELQGERRSLLGRLLRWVTGALLRESGF
jgi:putative peptide zinc metalloprotease protein